MEVRLSLDAKLFLNTGTYAVPVWLEFKNIKDLTLALEGTEADVTTRGNSGWGAVAVTILRGTVEFDMVRKKTSDAQYIALRDAFLTRTAVEFAVMDGDIATPGSEGLRALFAVTKFSRDEKLEESIMSSVSLKPTYSDNPPDWLVIT